MYPTCHRVMRRCLLDGVPPSAPPDVPPRNPTMNRMNGRVTGNPTELGVDFEPSCLVRTPSGNVYIPSGNLEHGRWSVSSEEKPTRSAVCLIWVHTLANRENAASTSTRSVTDAFRFDK
uniref:Uncharacterized protein n=1 Tax=Anopheles stephensi TaxID=30069 RepID=A0A182YBK1_ANOST